MEMHTTESSKRHLPLAGSALPVDDIDAELRAFEENERARLGLRTERAPWRESMRDPVVKRTERSKITLLISGLTAAQDKLVEGALSGLGYNVKYFGMPDGAALQTGKEFGNRGQCNPTYFTVGNLVKHLIHLRDVEKISTPDILKNYVFLTAGACGPCRFGMYVTEYRKALRDAGFDGFRVMLFQQQGGLSQATGDDPGIDMSPQFFIGIVKSLFVGDALNALAYRIRPFEIEPGATDNAVARAKEILYDSLKNQTSLARALWQSRALFAAVKVDKLRAKPKVSIIGEFWAMTTEGDGNYFLQRFLEKEGGENDIQLVTAVLLYNIWEVARDTRERAHLRTEDKGRYGLDGLGEVGVARRLAIMRLAEGVVRGGFTSFAWMLGLRDYHLPDMEAIADLAKDYYSHDLRGGEGHLEVGKLIMNSVRSKSHMTVSVKPFGCMPSSGVSDGVQSLVQSRFPQSIFCAVETSGDGATNFYSRVQMFLYKARQAAVDELAQAYEKTGVTEEQVRAFLRENPSYASSLHHPPHTGAGTATNLVYEVAPLIKQTRVERVKSATRGWLKTASRVTKGVPSVVRSAWALAREPETRARIKEDLVVLREMGEKVIRTTLFAPAQ